MFIESLFCDGNYTSSNGTVSSPSFSSRSTYENSLDCTYDIEVGSEYGIKLLWSTFDVRVKCRTVFKILWRYSLNVCPDIQLENTALKMDTSHLMFTHQTTARA